MAATTYFKTLVLDHALLQKPFSIQDWYLGLWTANPTQAGLLAGEVTAGDYIRKGIGWTAAYDNDALIQWAPALSSWGTITYIALINSPTKGTGNMLGYQSAGPFLVEIGRPLEVPIGGLIADLI